MKRWKKVIFITLILIILITSVSLTVSYLKRRSATSNKFTAGTTTHEIIEDFDAENKLKSNVKIKNTGNVSQYVRVSIIFTWQDSDDNIIDEIPVEDEDYSLTLSSSSNWIRGSDSYYYYKVPLEKEEVSDILIEECKQLKQYTNKILVVDVSAQSIQATPIKAVKEAWGVNIENENIVVN